MDKNYSNDHKAHQGFANSIQELKLSLKPATIGKLAQARYTFFLDFHFGLNMYLRNKYIYPNDKATKALLKISYLNHFGEYGEGIILEHLWRAVHNRSFSAQQMVDLQNDLRILSQKRIARNWLNKLETKTLIHYHSLLIGMDETKENFGQYLKYLEIYASHTIQGNEKLFRKAQYYLRAVEGGYKPEEVEQFIDLFLFFREREKDESEAYKLFRSYKIPLLNFSLQNICIYPKIMDTV